LTTFSSSFDSFIETFYYQDSYEKVNSLSFLPRNLATIKSFNDKNEAIKLVKGDDVKRRIEDARNFFGDKRPKFECYSITDIDPSSELLRIGARHVSYDNSAENSKTLIESSQQEKKSRFTMLITRIYLRM